MATYDTLEKSTQDSRPFEIYDFQFGSAAPYCYTSAEDDVTVGGTVYSAEPGLSRGRVSRSSGADGRSLSVTLRTENLVAQEYVGTPPATSLTVRVYGVQRDETPSLTAVPLFVGKAEGVKFSRDGTECEIVVRSLESMVAQNLPRFTYMAQCNHFLFDSGCGVSPASHTYTGTVSSVSGSTITVTGASGSGHDFAGGFVKTTTGIDFRQVLAVAGDVLTLDLPFESDLTGASVDVYAGCDHLIDGDCALVFDNVAEFGGFAFVPTKNVFETGLD